jgi:hypothetical protein
MDFKHPAQRLFLLQEGMRLVLLFGQKLTANVSLAKRSDLESKTKKHD